MASLMKVGMPVPVGLRPDVSFRSLCRSLGLQTIFCNIGWCISRELFKLDGTSKCKSDLKAISGLDIGVGSSSACLFIERGERATVALSSRFAAIHVRDSLICAVDTHICVQDRRHLIAVPIA